MKPAADLRERSNDPILCLSGKSPSPLCYWDDGTTGSTDVSIFANPDESKLEELATPLVGVLSARFYDRAKAQGVNLSLSRAQTLSRSLLGNDQGTCKERSSPFEIPQAHAASEADFEPKDYLHLIPAEIRKALGQHVTPQPIIQHILRAAGYVASREVLEGRLCDPACGSGFFLVEALKTYLGALRRAKIPPDEWYTRARTHFVGIDVDPIACLYARFNLALLLVPAILAWIKSNPRRLPGKLPIYHKDTLSALAAEWHARRPLAPQLVEGFDFVVGNPPYRKIGSLPSLLRDLFQPSVFGHPNAYGLFLHAAIEMLRPQGRLGFIVPRSMLSGLYFQNLRRLIEERTQIEEVTLLADRKKVFSEVLQGTMILVLQKPGRLPRAPGEHVPAVRTAAVRSLAELESSEPRHFLADACKVTRRLNGTTIWFISDQERTYSILDRVLDRHPLLNSSAIACPARTGPIVWNRVKPALRRCATVGTLPLVWATDVSRFRFEFATAADFRPAFLEESPKTRGLATIGPSILVQRVTADEQARRIVASLSAFPPRQRYFVENHLNLLQPAIRESIDLHYLLGVISSDIVEFLFRSMNGNTQVSATELNLLPVPRGGFEQEIASVVSALRDTNGACRADLETELNDRVARAFGLSTKDLAFVQSILAEKPSIRESRHGAR